MLTLYSTPTLPALSFNSLFENLERNYGEFIPSKNSSIKYSLSKDENNYYVDILAAGVSKENITIEASPSSLTINTNTTINNKENSNDNKNENIKTFDSLPSKEISKTSTSFTPTILFSNLPSSTPSKLLISLPSKIDNSNITSSYNKETHLISLTLPLIHTSNITKVTL